MTFDDDYVILAIPDGSVSIPCVELGLQWPPPDVLIVSNINDSAVNSELTYYRSRLSSLTDDQRAGMSHVCRGAEYLPFIPETMLN